jgi:hypothetical protein
MPSEPEGTGSSGGLLAGCASRRRVSGSGCPKEACRSPAAAEPASPDLRGRGPGPPFRGPRIGRCLSHPLAPATTKKSLQARTAAPEPFPTAATERGVLVGLVWFAHSRTRVSGRGAIWPLGSSGRALGAARPRRRGGERLRRQTAAALRAARLVEDAPRSAVTATPRKPLRDRGSAGPGCRRDGGALPGRIRPRGRGSAADACRGRVREGSRANAAHAQGVRLLRPRRWATVEHRTTRTQPESSTGRSRTKISKARSGLNTIWL